MLPSFEPMRLAHLRQPFDHKDWVFELKYDGFRALAYIENGSARVVSRRYNAYKTFNMLCSQIVQCLRVENAILDGEIVCLGKDGRPRFHDLLRRRSPQYFYAFDLLWLNGRDLRGFRSSNASGCYAALFRRSDPFCLPNTSRALEFLYSMQPAR